MADFDSVIDDLIAANRILAAEGVVDSFGHVSVRHPERADRFLISRNKSPQIVQPEDIMTMDFGGNEVKPTGRAPYGERFIHAAIYAARPEVGAVVHSHSRTTIPFGVTEERLRPISHVSATIGAEVPIWDPQDQFGDTNMLVSSIELGHDLARSLADRPAILMRGHGSTIVGQELRDAVYTAVYLEVNAQLQLQARLLNAGAIKFLTAGEIEKFAAHLNRHNPNVGYDKAWENWCIKCGQPYKPRAM
ncbi:MAG: class II aldolase/adducin family protein [Xanthobacteraceae bacterium]